MPNQRKLITNPAAYILSKKKREYKYMITVEDIAVNVLVVLCKLLMISESA
jgi:hypothetical protein